MFDLARLDSICALSSAQGMGAIAVIRVSGPNAVKIFKKIFSRKNHGEIKPFVAMHGDVTDEFGKIIDNVMAIYFKKPKSFTGEDSFEIYAHGNQIIVDQILTTLCMYGARLAQPGEFSLRAVLNDKIDLAQAESILDLIHAKSEAAKTVALKGVKGGLFKKITPVQKIIVKILAEIEARMDFPDEDLGSYHRKDLVDELSQAIEIINNVLQHAHLALKLCEGARVVICGLPNAGKSTLLNQLCGDDKAIVHKSAGTTRDVIEAPLVLNGFPITLIDVAGIRKADDSEEIENIGINKAVEELKRAQLIIWLADCTMKNPFGDQLINEKIQQSNTKVIKVLNKKELAVDASLDGAFLAISAKLGFGISDLKALIHKKLTKENIEIEELFITRARQRDELQSALIGLMEGKNALSLGLVDEVVASELRSAGSCFDRLFGTEISNDVLDKIFSDFCIGK